jgi:heterodisulfide reductase subunit B
MSQFNYFPGCSLHGTAREYDESTRAVAEALAIGLREIDDWVCCGATPAHATDPAAAHALGLWNLARASKMGPEPVVTSCAACFSRLRAAREDVQARPASAQEARSITGLPVGAKTEVLHFAQVLARPETQEKLKASVQKPFNKLPVAVYYGCLLTRPPGPGAIDDAEDPHILEDLVRLTGAEPIDWPLRLDCCGSSMALARPDLVRNLCGKLLASAHQRGAKAMIVACPLCHSNLDFQQEDTAREHGFSFRLPVLYLTQLIGLALGIPAELLGVRRHFVPVRVAELAMAQ